MCGINGYIGEAGKLEGQNLATKHRGPDYSGSFTDGKINIGHNLLSIRGELKKSVQPVKNDSWVLAYNGQLYNAPKGRLDTTWLFELINKHGWDFYKHIHGMFAVALYNKQEQVIRLYRDPSGQKNLYYYHKDSEFIFSSEIKAILEHNIDNSVDEEAVRISTQVGYIPGHKTLFKYISKLEPSQVVSFNIATKQLSRELFATPGNDYYGDKGFGEAMTSLVHEHLAGWPQVVVNLSGGLDSSLLVHEMRENNYDIKAYTNHFDIESDKYNLDFELARKLAKDYGAKHEEVFVDKDSYYNNFVESYEIIEEPNYNISLPIYLQTAKREGINGDGLRVVLSGDGGDEIFAGYPYYKKRLSFKNRLKNVFSSPADVWANGRGVRKIDQETLGYLEKIYKNYGKNYKIENGPVYDLMIADRIFWMTSENFIRSDKLYMSESMELRSPLSYQPFRTHMDKLLKSDDYVGKNNKEFLRKYYKGKLPDYITERRDKTGWRAPIDHWYDKRFKDLFLSVLPKEERLINWPEIRRQVEGADKWPGKHIHLYLSLAILSSRFKLDI